MAACIKAQHILLGVFSVFLPMSAFWGPVFTERYPKFEVNNKFIWMISLKPIPTNVMNTLMSLWNLNMSYLCVHIMLLVLLVKHLNNLTMKCSWLFSRLRVPNCACHRLSQQSRIIDYGRYQRKFVISQKFAAFTTVNQIWISVTCREIRANDPP